MTALTKSRMKKMERWTYKQFTLASGQVVFKNGIAAINLATGKVEEGSAKSTLLVIGTFNEDKDATSGDTLVNVNMGLEIEVEWWTNDSGTAITSANIGSLCYVLDDNTVTGNPASASVAGRVWAVDATKGVAVQKLSAAGAAPARLVNAALAAFSSNNINVVADPQSGAIYDVPTTGAASTITLPASAVAGTILYFVADGTKNGHTVQYRDATGTVNITTALTASKRHLVICTFLNSTWNANAYVSP